eukprot:TRINITY_DN80869_c0_g1_i1.p1 TRINITY_DN80869_c0_g1~~TRINITY_DN80869_c0_g1_i1.p1  ORF type:complete len:671 (-),score=89.96 TRINITY_DN80869_c0_g1_i1:72-2084(-)
MQRYPPQWVNFRCIFFAALRCNYPIPYFHNYRQPITTTITMEKTVNFVHQCKENLPQVIESVTKDLRANFKAGVTVSLVSLPLSLALATASGTDPARGYQAAFWSGLFASLFGGSEYNIVGPTGALSGVLLTASVAASDEVLPILALGSAILCFLMWAFRLVRFIMLVPSSVMEGFTLGVALIIAFGQLPAMLGLRGLERHSEFLPNVFEALSHIGDTHAPTLCFFLTNFILLFVLSKKWPKLPWSIGVACIGVVFGWLSDTETIKGFNLVTLSKLYGDIPRRVARPVQWSYIWEMEPGILASSSGGIAFITILETLISARIADQQTGTQHKQQREVLGIAVANFACAFTGSMPCTAALARTALNINSGATSRVSGVINSFMILILSLALMPLFKHLPMASIAALLTMVAVKMVEVHEIIRFWKFHRISFAICMLCALLCLIVDTIMGLVVGALASLLIFAERMSHSFSDISVHVPNGPVEHLSHKVLAKEEQEFQRRPSTAPHGSPFLSHVSLLDSTPGPSDLADDQPADQTEIPDIDLLSPVALPDTAFNENVLLYQVAGLLNYVNAKAHYPHVRFLATTRPVHTVCIHLRFLFYIDLDGIDALHEYIQIFRASGKEVYLTGATQGNVPRALRGHGWFLEMLRNGQVFEEYEDAMAATSRSQPNSPSL